MAETTAQQRGYPLAVYNFRVTVDGASMRFARVSGLQREYQTVTYRHGLSFAEGERIAKYRVDAYLPVTLERGLVRGGDELQRWFMQKTPSQMEVSLCDAGGVPMLAWRIARALPVKLSAPAFDAKSNEVAIESLEIRAAGISVVQLERAS